MKTNNKQLKDKKMELEKDLLQSLLQAGPMTDEDIITIMNPLLKVFDKEIDKVRNETIDECLGVLIKWRKGSRNYDTNCVLTTAIESLKELYDTTK